MKAGAVVMESSMNWRVGPDRAALEGPPSGPAGRAGRAGKVVEVVPFGLVELQRPGDGVKDAFGGAGQVPALKLGVVVHADTGEHRHLFAAQAGDPASAAKERQPCHFGSDPGAP